jgi:hypothetical protein
VANRLTDAELAARIEALEGELRDLRQQQCDRRDRRLVAVLARCTAGAVFSAQDLIDHTRLDAELRAVLEGLTPRRLGKRLAALADRPVAGLCVRRITENCAGWVWGIDIHRATGPAAGSGR